MYRNYDILVEGQVLAADLIPLNLKEFDAILGMDWLSIHRAKVDCLRKKIVFHTSDGKRVYFIGERKMLPSCMLSALTINILLREEYEAFLACVVSLESSSSELPNILVVHEFLDIFSEELPMFSLDREIEFSIDLLLGPGPIARAPYRMAPTKLRELKVQLQELLDKGFIRPSVSP